MNATIIFGSKKLGQSTVKASSEKYPNIPVVTIEGQKGPNKSRRVLINSKASELLSLEAGFVQQIVFASLEINENAERQVLIANKSKMPAGSEEMTSYKTSKNKVSFGENTSEKGKAISSSKICGEIFDFLSQNDSSDIEFKLVNFDSEEVEAYAFSSNLEESKELDTPASALDIEADVEVIETSSGAMNAEELSESVKEEVLKAESLDPVIEESPAVEVSSNELSALLPNDWE